jgi:outer membrane protein assembly factor BamB
VGGAEADRVVVCVSIDEMGPDPQDLSVLQPRRARLLVLAPGTGEVLEERSVDPRTSVAALGADVVVQGVADDGAVTVSRSDPRSGRVRWTFASPPTAPPPQLGPVLTDDGLVVVPGEAGWVLDGDGDVVHAWEVDRPAPAGWADVQRGRVLIRPMRDLLGSTSVVDLDSGRSFLTDGYPLAPTADDGSTGELVLIQSALGDGLVAYDLGTGRPVWSVDGEDAGGVVVLGGRVVRAESDALRAVDARSGVTVWVAPSLAARQYGLYTDGRVVVRAELDDVSTELVARDLDDGRVRWRTPLASDLEHLVELEGHLLGLTRDGIVAYGPAGA